MRTLEKSRLILCAMGFIFIAAASLISVASLNTYNRGDIYSEQSTLPEGIHIPININTATAEELCLLPDIGEATAKDIVSYRSENGDFTAKEDIMKVDGIGEKTYNKIKSYIVAE